MKKMKKRKSNKNWKVISGKKDIKKVLKKKMAKSKKAKKVKKAVPPIIRYEKKQCTYMKKKNGKRCKKWACGNGTLCVTHGGKPVVIKDLIPSSEMLPSHLKLTKFNPSKHPLLYIDLSRQGMSKTEIASQFEVPMATLNQWCQTFKEMGMASEIGDEMHKAWWLTEGKGNLDNIRYNTGMYKFLTGNLLGFSDKIESKNLNMNVSGVLVAPEKLSPEEWIEAAKQDEIRANAIEAEFTEENEEA